MKLDINKLNEAVEKAFDKIFEEEDRKEVKNTEPTQWHDDYSNKEEKNVVQTRINPETKKPEFKIPTNDKVYDTRDAAIAALNENNKNKTENSMSKKVIAINEDDIRNMVMEALNELSPEFLAHSTNVAAQRGRTAQAQNLQKGAQDAFNRDYGFKGKPTRDGNVATYGYSDAGDDYMKIDNLNDYSTQYKNGADAKEYANAQFKTQQRNQYNAGEAAKRRMNNGLRPDGTPYPSLEETVSRVIREFTK